MSSNLSQKFDSERLKEMPMVDLAFEVLKSANTPFYYRDLMKEIARYRGLSEEEVNNVIAHVYTEINIDGRFACLGTNMWGLKRWYPVERSEDPIANAKRSRIINDDDDDDDDSYVEEEDTYSAEEEDFDSFDEDREFEDSEEDGEVDEAIDEDDLEGEDLDEADDEDSEDSEDDEEDEESI